MSIASVELEKPVPVEKCQLGSWRLSVVCVLSTGPSIDQLVVQAFRGASARSAARPRHSTSGAATATAGARPLQLQQGTADTDDTASHAASSILPASDLQSRAQPDEEDWRIMSGISLSQPGPGHDDEDAMSVHERLSATKLQRSLIPAR